ncbi:MAG: T9SS type A sorting domain-containing protein [Bacteroidales bacterium]|nr:T9SS type A sorting domain-containing protein [Bacteroidales bacterium]
MKLIKSVLILVFFLLTSLKLFSQTIYSEPALPTADESVIVYFNAQGTPLEGYNGILYTHTGITVNGNPWQYVIGSWGNNPSQPQLTKIGTDLYQLNISPSIREFYNAASNDEISQMCFVFRSADAGTQTEDLFLDVFESGLNVSITIPDQSGFIVEPGAEIIVEANATNSDSLKLFHDDILISFTTESFLRDTLYPTVPGTHRVKVLASKNTIAVADSFNYYVRGEVAVQELPQGIKDGINYINDSTVTLCLFAPFKEFVFVIGDFNNWELSEEYNMKKTPDGNRYWLEISGLVPQKEYIFQYFIDGEIKIADPYTDKISDPWNDKYISNSVYPNLISYPEGKTTEIASVLQTAQDEYQWQNTSFVPAKDQDLIIYELFVRDFTTEHTYQSLINKLDYFENLGINVIELMPINEFEGNSSWGYNPSFYFAPDKYYGPKNDLKHFIDECHGRGIAVLIDLVLNHSYDQSPFVRMYFDGSNPTEENPWYNVHSNFTNPDAQWGNDFNHESIYTKQLVDSINSYWMTEYKVDGFRFDFTKGFGNNIKGPDDPWGSKYDADRIALLKRMYDEIIQRNPNAKVIFEHLAENREEKELANYGIMLWGNSNYNYGEASMGWVNNSDFSWISYKKRGWNSPHVVGYMESHDEERLMYKNLQWGNSNGNYNIKDTITALKRMALVSSFFYTIPGPKMIWQFGELGYDYSIEYNGRLGEKPVRWDYYNQYQRKYLHDMISSLMDLKVNEDIFETENFSFSLSGAMKRIELNHESMNMRIIGNFGVTASSIDPNFLHTGKWYDYFSGDSISVSNTNDEISLLPGEYRIYSDKKLDKPDIGTGVNDITYNSDNEFSYVYPNPSKDLFNIIVNITDVRQTQIKIYNILGKEINTIVNKKLSRGIHNFTWKGRNYYGQKVNSGVYFYIIETGNIRETKKIILQ